jgi:hypothetical protein
MSGSLIAGEAVWRWMPTQGSPQVHLCAAEGRAAVPALFQPHRRSAPCDEAMNAKSTESIACPRERSRVRHVRSVGQYILAVWTPQKRGQKSETAPGGRLAVNVACMADIGRSGGRQPRRHGRC